jgi:quercetin dioxygenase-like cupin family protein
MNKFCLDLQIDNSDEFRSIIDNIIAERKKQVRSRLARQMFKITRDQFPELLVEWLKPFDLTVRHGEIFFLPPGVKHSVHIDGEFLDNHCKINWAVGGGESLMSWYEPLNDKAFVYQITEIGTKYLSFDTEYCKKVFEVKVGNPSLINAGQPHTVENTSEEDRWAVTFVLGDIYTGEKVQWERVFPLLERYRKIK